MALKSEIHSFLLQQQELCETCNEAEELGQYLREMQARMAQPLRVAVVGIMKAGKSTFMNALMGADILYTGELETTYTVCWFRYGNTPSLEIFFRDGSVQKAPFEDLEKWSVRAWEKDNPRINDVKYLVIRYPGDVLKQIEFIDTPGLNAVYGKDSQNTLDFLSIRSSEETLLEASAADAVIYAFTRSAAGFDQEILNAFHSGEGGLSSPINSIGILTKVDATGIWNLYKKDRPVEIARAVAEQTMKNETMRRVLYTVFPVCAKSVEGVGRLKEADWSLLGRLSLLEEKALKKLLWDSRKFSQDTEPPYSEAGNVSERKRLMDLLGQYGIYEVCVLLKEGKTTEEIGRLLREYCGIEDVRQILVNHFGNRAALIKVQFVLGSIRERVMRMQKQEAPETRLYHICAQIKEEIEAMFSSAQRLKELKVLQMYYNGQIEFDEKEYDDFMHITGEYGRRTEEKLGLDACTWVSELRAIARKKASLWHGKAGEFMQSGSYVEAANVLAHSYEQIYYHLNEIDGQ